MENHCTVEGIVNTVEDIVVYREKGSFQRG